MAELMRVQTGSGKLIVTEDAITLEFGRKARSIRRASVSGIDHKQTVQSIFGRGGAMTLVFHSTGGEDLEARMVPLKEAQKLLDLLGR